MSAISSINGIIRPSVEQINPIERLDPQNTQQKSEQYTQAEDKLEFSQRLEELRYINNINISYPNKNPIEKTPPQEEKNSNSSQQPNESTALNGSKLSEEEKRKVEELKKIDQAVQAHERAHQAAGGGLVRGTSFNYTTGPDGKQYATGGEVKIDISPVPDNPEATISKMQQVKRAALAPVDPSPQDRSVANLASTIEAKARQELQEEKTKENKNSQKLIENYKKAEKPASQQIGKNIDYSNIAEPYATLKLHSAINKYLQSNNSPYLLD